MGKLKAKIGEMKEKAVKAFDKVDELLFMLALWFVKYMEKKKQKKGEK